MTITKRLHEYFQHKGLSYYKIERTLQVSTGSLSGAVKHERNISSKVLQKIFSVYTDLSAEWLFRGRGSMILGESPVKEGEDLDYRMLSSDWLIDRVISFFNFKSKHELISFFERIHSKDLPSDGEKAELDFFESKVLEIVEKKYGSTLENAEELYALYLQKIMREGENMLKDDLTIEDKENSV